MNGRSRRKSGSGGVAAESAVGRRWRRIIGSPAIRKVRGRNGLKSIVAGAGASAAGVGHRKDGVVTTLPAIEGSTLDANHWSPRESGVEVEDTAQRPAAGNLFEPTVAAVKQRRLPDAKELKRLAD